VTARGNEPFWSAEVSGQTMTVTRPDAQPKSFAVRDQLTVERHIGSGPRSTTKVVETEDPGIKLTLTETACSDGMSDMTYKMAAELKLGGETLKGCAFFKADPPKQP
jgi:uncharacterized membrane protein